MSVYEKEGSPFWQIDFELFGRRYTRSSGTKQKSVAKAMEREWRRQIHEAHAAGVLGADTDIGFDVAAQIYWQSLTPEKRTTTLEAQIAMVVGLVGRDTPIANVDSLMMDAIMQDFRQRPNRNNPAATIGVASANVVPDIVSRVLNSAKKKLKITLPLQPERSEHYIYAEERIRELSYAEERELEKTSPPDFIPIWKLSIELGLRRKNCVTLRWSQVDWENMIITVRQKGGGIHVVQISETAAEILQYQRLPSRRHPEFVFTFKTKYPVKRDGKVYPSGSRVPINPGYFSQLMRRAFRKAGIADFTVHDFRHTCATRLLRVSNIDMVRKLLGHITEKMSRRYAKLVENDVRGAQMVRRAMDEVSRNGADLGADGGIDPRSLAGVLAKRLLVDRRMRDLAMDAARNMPRAA